MMGSPMRDIVAEGLTGIIRALPDQAIITIEIENLPRDKFDALRGSEEAVYCHRRFGQDAWTAMVELGAGVFLDIETFENPVLRAVS